MHNELPTDLSSVLPVQPSRRHDMTDYNVADVPLILQNIWGSKYAIVHKFPHPYNLRFILHNAMNE